MSEYEDLFAIHGAIDRAVQEDPTLANVVGRYIDAYRDDTTGWFDDFVRWSASLDFTVATDHEAALSNLADVAVSPRMAARRLHALAVAARVVPRFDATGPQVVAALSVDGLCGTGEGGRAEKLGALLVDDEVFPDLSFWGDLLARAVAEELIDPRLMAQSHAAPCVGTVVEIPGAKGPAAQFHTRFTAQTLDFQRAIRFLEPSLWPGCFDFWCGMDRVSRAANGNAIYRERVSLDCQSRFAWRAETMLEFSFVLQDDHAHASYDFAPNHPQPDDPIVVDQGWLKVDKVGAGVAVETLKVVRFSYPFTTAAIAKIMCALGYGDAAQQLVFNCALGRPEEEGADFPAETSDDESPTGRNMRRPQGGTAEGAGGAATGEGQDPMAGIADDAADAVARCIRECASAYRASYDKVGQGRYDANALASDMTDMWKRYMRDGALAYNFLVRVAEAAAVPSPAPRPAPAPAPPSSSPPESA